MSSHPAHALPGRRAVAGTAAAGAAAGAAAVVTSPDAADWARIAVATVARGLVAVLLGLAFWAVAPLVLGWQPTTVMTGSMEPRIQVGDVVVARPVAETSLQPGQVLLFDDPDQAGHLRLHRFAEPGVDGLVVTKGDANPELDSTPVERSAVHGVAMVRVPAVGLPVVWAREGQWSRLALVAAAFAVVLALTTLDGPLRRGQLDSGADGGDDAGPRVPPLDGHEEARPAHPSPVASATPSDPVPAHARGTRRELRRLERRRRRLRAAAAGTAVVVGAAGIGFLLPAEALAAPFGARTTSPTSTMTAYTVPAATAVTCVNSTSNSGVVISWSYATSVPASDPASFTVTIGSATQDFPGATRAISYNNVGLLDLGTVYPVTLRTNDGSGWTKPGTNTTGIRIVSVLGLGATVRCAT